MSQIQEEERVPTAGSSKYTASKAGTTPTATHRAPATTPLNNYVGYVTEHAANAAEEPLKE